MTRHPIVPGKWRTPIAHPDTHPELLMELTSGISNLASSLQWQHYLDVQSRFHRYSYGNALLIAAQRSDATYVAGFNSWRSMNRSIRRGEHAIWILAPLADRSTEPGDELSRRAVRGFKWVPVFDIGQTDGDPLPSVCRRLEAADTHGNYALLESAAGSSGFRVENHEFDDGTNGDCCHADRLIRIATRTSPAHRIKTFVHDPFTAPARGIHPFSFPR